MRIAYVCADPGVPLFGTKGSSVHAQEIIGAMLRQGHEVTIFGSSVVGTPATSLHRARVVALPAIQKGDQSLREQGQIEANVGAVKLLDAHGPFDLLYERHSLFSWAAMQHARERAIASVLEVNAPLIEEQKIHRTLLSEGAAVQSAGRALAAADVVVAVSHPVARYAASHGADAERIMIVPNGVDPNRFPERVEPAVPRDGRFTAGFVGSLKPWHGLPLLAEIFALLRSSRPEARLVIVGDGPERSSLEADLAKRGLLGGTIFTGSVPPREVARYFASVDATLAPYPATSDFYFSPLKIVESMAAGTPVVASRIGDIPDLIDDGADGFLCAPGEAAGFTAALAALAEDERLRRSMGAAGRRKVLAAHTWDAILARVLARATDRAATEARA